MLQSRGPRAKSAEFSICAGRAKIRRPYDVDRSRRTTGVLFYHDHIDHEKNAVIIIVIIIPAPGREAWKDHTDMNIISLAIPSRVSDHPSIPPGESDSNLPLISFSQQSHFPLPTCPCSTPPVYSERPSSLLERVLVLAR